jgi:osmotically inducible lipoprotein OsmB
MLRITCMGIIAVSVIGLSGCANMSGKTKGTLIGGTTGAVAGQLITQSPIGMVAGAVAGGAIGHYIGGKSDKKS